MFCGEHKLIVMEIFLKQKLSNLWPVAHIYDKAKYCSQKLCKILGGAVKEALPITEKCFQRKVQMDHFQIKADVMATDSPWQYLWSYFEINPS